MKSWMSYKLNLNLSVRDETEVLEEEEWKRRTTLPWLWKEIDQDLKMQRTEAKSCFSLAPLDTTLNRGLETRSRGHNGQRFHTVVETFLETFDEGSRFSSKGSWGLVGEAKIR